MYRDAGQPVWKGKGVFFMATKAAWFRIGLLALLLTCSARLPVLAADAATTGKEAAATVTADAAKTETTDETTVAPEPLKDPLLTSG